MIRIILAEDHNLVRAANLSGVFLNNCESCQISGNDLAACGQQANSTHSGILIGASRTCNVQGNTVRDSLAMDTGTAQSGGADTIQLATTAHSANDWYNGLTVAITGGTGSGQSKTIADYTGSTRTATVSTAWATPPDNTSVYAIYNSVRTYYGIRITSGVGNLVTNNDLLGVHTPLSDAGTGTITAAGNRS